jgi:hypothetical protein
VAAPVSIRQSVPVLNGILSIQAGSSFLPAAIVDRLSPTAHMQTQQRRITTEEGRYDERSQW